MERAARPHAVVTVVAPASSTVRFTDNVGGTDTLTATTASGRTYTSATASLKLFL